MAGRVSAIVEFAAALAAVLAALALTTIVQERIDVNQGRGYDGAIYHRLAEQFQQGERPSHNSRFAKRIGTPWLAATVDSRDLINGFQVVNTWGTILSSVLLLVWLRMFVRQPWLRVALVALFATHWLQLVRFTVFYPVLVDAWAQVCCFAGLIGIVWYQRSPGRLPVLLVTVASVAGVVFRELVLLIPLAFLCARNPGVAHRLGFPYIRATNLPVLEQWIPLALAVTAFVWVGTVIVPADPAFSAADHLADRNYSRSLVSFSLGWLVAFGPVLFVLLYDWRSVGGFFSRHRALLVFMLGVAVLGWAASRESERHALNWGSPVVYLLFALAVERQAALFRSRGLVAFLVATQVIVGRLFVTIPQPDPDYLQQSPLMLLTPVGGGASYLHLFPDYLPSRLALIQLAEFAALGAVLLIWLSRRAYLRRSEDAGVLRLDRPPAEATAFH